MILTGWQGSTHQLINHENHVTGYHFIGQSGRNWATLPLGTAPVYYKLILSILHVLFFRSVLFKVVSMLSGEKLVPMCSTTKYYTSCILETRIETLTLKFRLPFFCESSRTCSAALNHPWLYCNVRWWTVVVSLPMPGFSPQFLVQQTIQVWRHCAGPRRGELRTQKLKSYLMRTQSLKVLPFKPGVGQYIAMHVTLTARDFFFANFYPSGPFTCIFL